MNIEESDNQNTPDTPSESSSSVRTTTQVTPPTTTTVATQVSCTGTGDSGNLPASCVPAVNTPQNNAETPSQPSQVQPSEASDEKVTPYYHSILQQVAEGSTGTETSSISAQRVTINMRTFKVCTVVKSFFASLSWLVLHPY